MLNFITLFVTIVYCFAFVDGEQECTIDIPTPGSSELVFKDNEIVNKIQSDFLTHFLGDIETTYLNSASFIPSPQCSFCTMTKCDILCDEHIEDELEIKVKQGFPKPEFRQHCEGVVYYNRAKQERELTFPVSKEEMLEEKSNRGVILGVVDIDGTHDISDGASVDGSLLIVRYYSKYEGEFSKQFFHAIQMDYEETASREKKLKCEHVDFVDVRLFIPRVFDGKSTIRFEISDKYHYESVNSDCRTFRRLRIDGFGSILPLFVKDSNFDFLSGAIRMYNIHVQSQITSNSDEAQYLMSLASDLESFKNSLQHLQTTMTISKHWDEIYEEMSLESSSDSNDSSFMWAVLSFASFVAIACCLASFNRMLKQQRKPVKVAKPIEQEEVNSSDEKIEPPIAQVVEEIPIVVNT